MSVFIDFNAVPNGTLLENAGLGFTKLASSSANTLTINSGALDFGGTASVATWAYETGQVNHSFSAKWSTSGNGANFAPVCVRIVDFRNFLYARITAASNVEIGQCINGTLTNYSGGSIAITRTANDVVLLTASGNTITCYVNGVQKFQTTDATFNTATKVGICQRTTALTNVITEVTIDFTAVTSINGGSAIPAGKTGVASVTAGFSGLPTSIATSVGVTCSNIGGTTNAPTFDINYPTDGSIYPKSGTSVLFTFTRGTEIASASQVVTKRADETEIVLSAPVTNNITYVAGAILAQTGRTLATGDVADYIVPPGMSDLVMAADTGITVTNAGTFEMRVYINAGADAGKNYFYTVTVAAGGAVVSISFAKKITATKLTATKLTATKLTAKKA